MSIPLSDALDPRNHPSYTRRVEPPAFPISTPRARRSARAFSAAPPGSLLNLQRILTRQPSARLLTASEAAAEAQTSALMSLAEAVGGAAPTPAAKEPAALAPPLQARGGRARIPRDASSSAIVQGARAALHEEAWACLVAFHAAWMAAVRPTDIDAGAVVAEAEGGAGTAARRRVGQLHAHITAGEGVGQELWEALTGGGHIVPLARALFARAREGGGFAVDREDLLTAVRFVLAPLVAPRIAAERAALAEVVRLQGVVARRLSTAGVLGALIGDGPSAPHRRGALLARSACGAALLRGASMAPGSSRAPSRPEPTVTPSMRHLDATALVLASRPETRSATPQLAVPGRVRQRDVMAAASHQGEVLAFSTAAGLLSSGVGVAEALAPVLAAAARLASVWETAHPADRQLHGLDARMLLAALRVVACPLALPHESCWWALALASARPPARGTGAAPPPAEDWLAPFEREPPPLPAYSRLVVQAAPHRGGPLDRRAERDGRPRPPQPHWPGVLAAHLAPSAAVRPTLRAATGRGTLSEEDAVAVLAALCTGSEAASTLRPLLRAALSATTADGGGLPAPTAAVAPMHLLSSSQLLAALERPPFVALLSPLPGFELLSGAAAGAICAAETGVLAMGPPGHLRRARELFAAHAREQRAGWGRRRALLTAALAAWRRFRRARRGLRRFVTVASFLLLRARCPEALRRWAAAARAAGGGGGAHAGGGEGVRD